MTSRLFMLCAACSIVWKRARAFNYRTLMPKSMKLEFRKIFKQTV